MQSAAEMTLVVVTYRTKPGKEEELLQLTCEHVSFLRKEVLAAARPVVAGRAADGTVVGVFEWAPGGVERAHSNPVVLKLLERYAAACEIVPLNQLAESSTMFASFAPIDID